MNGWARTAALLVIALAGADCRTAAATSKEAPMKTINPELLRGCLDGSMRIYLGRVTSASIRLAGTRSQSSVCEVEVIETICGDPLRRITAWQYASEPHLRQGATYVLAIELASGVVPPPDSMSLGPEEAIEVPPGEEVHAVEAHRQAIAALRAGR